MTEQRIERIGDAVLYLGNCLDVLPTLPKAGAVVADPPYGIGYKRGAGGNSLPYGNKPDWDRVIGDDSDFDPSPWLAWPCILWGANHYAQKLPRGRWLAWNKLGDFGSHDDFSDVELAWNSKRAADKIFNYLWKGVRQAGEKNEKRHHPTQKPVALMEWCLGFVPDAEVIIDPYMGSGTTGVACAGLGRQFIGVEIDPRYFNIACDRIRAVYAQRRLFA